MVIPMVKTAPIIVDINCILFLRSAEKIEPRNICIIKKEKLISKASKELLKFIINK